MFASSANAVASAGKGAAQVFTAAEIGGVRIADALIDTGSAFSMLSAAMYSRLPSAAPIQPFTCAAPDVVGVGGASAEIRGYVDTPVEIAGTAVHHPEYEQVNPLANKQPFEQYVSAAPTRMFSRDGTISAFGNPYIDSLQILTDRIREFNAKYIRDKSGLRLARVLEFTLKMVKYAPLEGRGWQPLPKFLSTKKAILNFQNNDERCFGYASLLP